MIRVQLFILISLLFALSFQIDFKAIELEQTYTVHIKQTPLSNSQVTYRVNIPKKIHNNNLIMIADPINQESDPDIYFSKNKNTLEKIIQKLQNKNYDFREIDEKVVFACNNFGAESCVLQSSEITDNTDVYISLGCSFQKECGFNFKVIYTGEWMIKAGEIFDLSFKNTYAQIIKIYVPDIELAQKKDIDNLQIIATLSNPAAVNETFHFYVNQGNEVPSTQNHDYKSVDSWFGGKGVEIGINAPNNLFLRFNQNYTILIQAPLNAEIKIQTQFQQKVQQMQMHRPYFGIINKNEQKFYEFDVPSAWQEFLKDKDLVVFLYSFSGNPQLYVNSDFIPNNNSDYHYQNHELLRKYIKITPQDRKNVSASNSKFFIMVDSQGYSASYMLRVFISNQNMTGISFGQTQHNMISKDSLFTYFFEITDEEKYNMTLDLQTLTGGADMVIKVCNTYQRFNCLTSKEEFESDTVQSSNGIIYRSQEYDKTHHFITLEHNPQICQPKGEASENWKQIINQFHPLQYICVYAITVKGLNPGNNSYSLLIQKSKDQNIVLKENELHRGYLEEGQSNYYQFNLIRSSDHIEEISFIVTPITGHLILFSSRQSKKPNIVNHEQKSSYIEQNIHYVIKKQDEKLDGNYYVSVTATSSTYYTLIAKVKRNGNTQIQILYEGYPQKLVTNDINQLNFFSINLDSSNHKENSNINFLLEPIQGSYEMFVNHNSLPKDVNDKSSYTWQTNKTLLSISSNDKNYKNQGTYYLAIKQTDNTAHKQQYFVRYYLNKTIQTLALNIPYTSSLLANQQSYLKLQIPMYHLQNDIDLTFNVKSGNRFDAALYGSFKQQYSSEGDDIAFTIKGQQSHQLISNKNLSQNCGNEKLKFGYRYCVIYLTVISKTDTQFSVTAKENTLNSKVLIIDGLLYELNLPSDPALLNLYYYPPIDKTISVNLVSHMNYIGIYAKVSSINNLDMPTNSTYTFSSLNHTNFISSSMTITHDEIDKQCEKNQILRKDCILTFRVYKDLNQSNFYWKQQAKNTFTFEVTSKIQELVKGIPLISNVRKEEYQYFQYYNKENGSIIFSLTTITGSNVDILIKKGQDSRPSVSDFGQRGRAWTSEKIVYKNASIGYYTIGIYGYDNCSFSLLATGGNFRYQNIYVGFPQSLVLHKDEITYLQYENWYNSSFKILLSHDFGSVDMIVKKYGKHEDPLQSLPSFNNLKDSVYNNINNNDGRELIYVKNNTANFCSECSYVIALRPQLSNGAKVDVFITQDNSFVYLRNGQNLMDFVKMDTQNRYNFYSYNKQIYQITFTIFSGQISVYLNNKYTIGKQKDQYKKLIVSAQNQKYIHITNEDLQDIETQTNNKTKQFYGNTNSILVYGNSDANYSINVHSSSQAGALQYGMPTQTNIEKQAQYIFYDGQFKNGYFTIQLKNLREILQKYYQPNQNFLMSLIDLELIYMEENFKKSGSKNISIELKGTQVDNNLLAYNFTLDKNQDYPNNFLLTIKNKLKDQPINISITLQNKYLNFIHDNQPILGSIPTGMYRNYQVQAEYDGTLFVEAFQCGGKNQIFASNNYQNFINRAFDLQVKSPVSPSHLVSMYNVKQGPIYLAVKGISPSSQSLYENQFMLRTYLFPKNSNPIDPYDNFVFVSPRIDWKYQNEKDIEVQVQPIQCQNNQCKGQTFVPQKISYNLYVANNILDLDRYVQCKIISKFNDTVYTNPNYEQNFNLEKINTEQKIQLNLKDLYDVEKLLKLEQDNTLYITVKATIQLQYNDLFNNELTFIYEPIQIQPKQILIQQIEQDSSSGSYTLLILVILLLIVSISFLIYYFRRYKRIEKQLNYELNDVRNVANIKSQNSLNTSSSSQYKGLMNEGYSLQDI